MSSKFLCIHSHFYQPPRENPWLEAIDYQESASPYHDWNERVTAECYRPNGQSRILDHEGRVVRLTNNYARISFNFGPTILSWLEQNDQVAYSAILEGDKKSRERFGGHGSAIAQAYNHVILPLANRRDKETQIKWGLRDFEKRFGREAEALWLPETAVDTETLEILADHGMKYVILAPRQAQADGGRLDTRQPYSIALPGRKSIAAFFYDGGISQAVAFEGLLDNGEIFARRLMGAFDNRPDHQLLHLATDGESYGHHHRYGDMALAYALDYIDRKKTVTLANYGQYLAGHPPQAEMKIHENSSWSCVHGIERWREDCGCNSGMRQDWRQTWRKPLRQAVDFLRDGMAGPYETFMAQYTDDPWGMRDGYIDVILNRLGSAHHEFFHRWLKKDINIRQPGLEQTLLKALEAQRHLLLSSTSCAWFFDEISGGEAVQGLQYAARAIELARDILNVDLEGDFVKILKNAPSNIPEFGDGQYVYEKLALPGRVDFLKFSAHLAAKVLFADKLKSGNLYCFDYRIHHAERRHSGKEQLVCAHITLISRITRETRDIQFVIIHLGDHNISAAAQAYNGDDGYNSMVADFLDVFGRGDIAKSLRLLDKYFSGSIFSLSDMFRDQRREIIDIVFAQTLETVEEQFRNIYQQHYPVMRYLSDIHVALPSVFFHIARFMQSRDIESELEKPEINTGELRRHLEEARKWGLELDASPVGQHYRAALNRSFARFRENAGDPAPLRQFDALLDMQALFPFAIDLGDIQNAVALWMYSGAAFANGEAQTLLDSVAGHLKIDRAGGNSQ
jgi:alpha-amylase/alpha-mannosidase (GH57 family)